MKYYVWFWTWRRGLSYFAVVNLKEADVGRKIQVGEPPVIKIGENILG